MSRSKLREKIFQLLFRVEFNPKEELEEQTTFFFEDEDQEGLSEKEREQMQEKFERILAKRAEIDQMIDEKSVGWNASRLGKVELAIMRLAIYEIIYDDSIPDSVSINEAVELAKKYAAEESPAFINAVLAKFATKEAK